MSDVTFSIGQPVATGAGAIPARLCTPDPINGGMRGKEMEEKHLKFIDKLREAAKEHGAVADLLGLIDDTIMIDDLGNKEIVAEGDAIAWLRAAVLAAQFVAMDRATNEPQS